MGASEAGRKRSDEDLIMAFYGGDDGAFDELYKRYFIELTTYLYTERKYLNVFREWLDDDLVQDCTEFALIKTMETRRRKSIRFDPDKNKKFAPWIKRIAFHHAISLIRSKKHVQIMDENDLNKNVKKLESVYTPWLSRRRSYFRNPRANSLDAQARRSLQHCLAVLEWPLNLIIVQYYYYGYKMKDIANSLDASITWVFNKKEDAYERLIHCLESKRFTFDDCIPDDWE